jgi:PII-like signaling protein
MGVPSNAALLRLYTEAQAKIGPTRLYELVVRKAREHGLAGATVLRGPMGYGQTLRVHTAKILDLSDKLPIVIEIADVEEKLRSFVALLGDLTGIGLVTLEAIEVLHYGKSSTLSDPGRSTSPPSCAC